MSKCECEGRLIAIACYGTLKSDGPLAHKEHIVCSSMDKVKGKLYEVPDGNFPFPAIKLDEETDSLVDVEIQIVTEWYKYYMDMVEGTMYTLKEVVTEGGTPCHIYEYNRGVNHMSQIAEWNNQVEGN